MTSNRTSVSESLLAIQVWLQAHGVEEGECPEAASPEALERLLSLGAPAELLEFYRFQNGLLHGFILYGTWQFLTLEEALARQDTLRWTPAVPDEPWNVSWLPLLTNNGGDHLVQDLQQGSLILHRHTDGERLHVSPSLSAFLQRLVQDLQAGEYVFEDGEPAYTGARILGEDPAERFVQQYLADEYRLWVRAHTNPDDRRFFLAAERFEARYFGPELYSDVSRPGGLDAERFAAFRGLLAAKQRPLYGVWRDSDGPDAEGTVAVLGSVDAGSTVRFELIRVRQLHGRLKIVSSYLTGFDGTFSYSGGEHVGERLPDPGESYPG